MSASLVGSEMCIRDRRLEQLPARSNTFAALPCAHRGGLQPLGPPRMAPVSYTHLTLPTICSV
eukprot:14077887-Alexandrium_andersonii.AAC.1